MSIAQFGKKSRILAKIEAEARKDKKLNWIPKCSAERKALGYNSMRLHLTRPSKLCVALLVGTESV